MKMKFKILIMLMLLLSFGCTNEPSPKELEKIPVIDKVKEESIIKTEKLLSGKIICIDPGHALTTSTKKEKLSPLSDITKDAYISGTFGKNLTEEKLNLAVALKLRKLLENNGAKVIMTREISEITISNVERAEIANSINADVSIHIHADGSKNLSTHGTSVLIPGGKLLVKPAIIEPSAILGKAILDYVVLNTGAENRGTAVRSDLTGFNWSKVPTIMIEMGFMSNQEEEKQLESELYQNKIAEGIYNGLVHYFYPNLNNLK